MMYTHFWKSMELLLDCRIGVRVLGIVAWRGAGQRRGERRMRVPSHRSLEEEEEDRSFENTRDVDLNADGEDDTEMDDMNTGSSHGDFEY